MAFPPVVYTGSAPWSGQSLLVCVLVMGTGRIMCLLDVEGDRPTVSRACARVSVGTDRARLDGDRLWLRYCRSRNLATRSTRSAWGDHHGRQRTLPSHRTVQFGLP